jgi:hypothetical protein
MGRSGETIHRIGAPAALMKAITVEVSHTPAESLKPGKTSRAEG